MFKNIWTCKEENFECWNDIWTCKEENFQCWNEWTMLFLTWSVPLKNSANLKRRENSETRIPADYVISEGDNLVKSPQI